MGNFEVRVVVCDGLTLGFNQGIELKLVNQLRSSHGIQILNLYQDLDKGVSRLAVFFVLCHLTYLVVSYRVPLRIFVPILMLCCLNIVPIFAFLLPVRMRMLHKKPSFCRTSTTSTST